MHLNCTYNIFYSSYHCDLDDFTIRASSEDTWQVLIFTTLFILSVFIFIVFYNEFILNAKTIINPQRRGYSEVQELRTFEGAYVVP